MRLRGERWSVDGLATAMTTKPPWSAMRRWLIETHSERSVLALVLATYVLTVHLSYVHLIVPRWAYTGMVVRTPFEPLLLLAVAGAMLPAFWLPTVIRRPSDVVIFVLYAMAYVPGLLIPVYVLDTHEVPLLPLIATVSASYLLLVVSLRVPRIRIPPPLMLSLRRYALGLFLVAAVLAAAIVAVLGLPERIPSLQDVYDVRADYREATLSAGIAIRYAVHWLGLVVAPLLLLVALQQRNGWYLVAALATQALLFAQTGLKATVFSVVLCIGLFLLLHARRPSPAILIGALSAIVVLATGFVVLVDSDVLLSLTARRLIALPGQLLGYYYEFFSQEPTYQLSHSVFRWWLDPPFPLTPTNQIGLVYFGDPATSANASLWADGMANFGLTGIALSSLGLAVMLWAIDAVSHGRDLRVAGGVAGMIGIVLASSGLLTSLLTNGIGLVCVLLVLMPLGRPGRAGQ